MLSQVASWMVEPHDAGVEKPAHRKAIIIGCGAVIVIGAASYTVCKYRHGIKAFFNRLYASTSQYMRVCLRTDKSSQEEVIKETGENDNPSTGEAQGEVEADIEGSGSAIPNPVNPIPIQVEQLLGRGLMAEETRDLMHGSCYIPPTSDFLQADDFLAPSFQQVDGGDVAQALYDAGLWINGGGAEENNAQTPKRG